MTAEDYVDIMLEVLRKAEHEQNDYFVTRSVRAAIQIFRLAEKAQRADESREIIAEGDERLVCEVPAAVVAGDDNVAAATDYPALAMGWANIAASQEGNVTVHGTASIAASVHGDYTVAIGGEGSIAASTGGRGVVSVLGRDSVAVATRTTHETSIFADAGSLAVAVGENVWWRVHRDAALVQMWAGKVALIRGSEYSDLHGKTVLVNRGKVVAMAIAD